jgi:hypothetical protein
MTVQLRGTATVENAIMAQLSEDRVDYGVGKQGSFLRVRSGARLVLSRSENKPPRLAPPLANPQRKSNFAGWLSSEPATFCSDRLMALAGGIEALWTGRPGGQEGCPAVPGNPPATISRLYTSALIIDFSAALSFMSSAATASEDGLS